MGKLFRVGKSESLRCRPHPALTSRYGEAQGSILGVESVIDKHRGPGASTHFPNIYPDGYKNVNGISVYSDERRPSVLLQL